MSRAVIRFQDADDGSGVWFCLQSPGGAMLSKLACRPNDKEFAFDGDPMITVAGVTLRDSLLAHKGISGRLDSWLKMEDKEFLSLQLQLESTIADQLPWEALVDYHDSFLALDSQSPLTRVLPADRQDRVRREFPFVPPLRIACVLGAWWDSGGLQQQADEWSSVRDGLAAAASADMPVVVRIYSCAAALEAQVMATPPPNVTLQWSTITGNAPALLGDINQFSPHILHLYAHGSAGDQQYLSVSTASDVAQGNAHGSILITPRDIRQVADRDEYVWSIALNCCDSAAMTIDGRHFAWQLVKFGFPAVIAMREAVKTTETRTVSRFFYEAALKALRDIPVGGRKDVEWASFLQRVRIELAGGNALAAQNKRWLIPVLYARTEPFQIFRCKPGLDEKERIRLRAQREELINQRDATLQTSMPADVKDQVRQVFDQKIAEIDAQLV
ncbi:MAG TPA: CHAT domain-containing protein [Povalibacter sp.]